MVCRAIRAAHGAMAARRAVPLETACEIIAASQLSYCNITYKLSSFAAHKLAFPGWIG
jgi:hypothetical protein